ncbi:MAG: hypothetical protein KDA28_04065, partial [Phycisphaerales bacterium]|nr:hypothetical protein [Phycisphaerales bacterium]
MIRLALLGAMLVSTVSTAQPEVRPDRRPGAPQIADDKDQVKERLQRRLDESKRTVATLEEALGRLDQGASPEEIARLTDFGRRRPDFDGGPDRDGGPEGDRLPPETPPLSPEEIEAFMATHLTDLHARMENAPDKQREFVHRRIAPRVQEIIGLQDSDPVLADLRTDELRTSFDLFGAARALHEARRDHGPDSD